MITKDNFKALLLSLDFKPDGNQFSKQLNNTSLTVDFYKQELIYPDGIVINERQTCNFSANENFVVFECVHRLLEKGYKPESIELEPKWKVGHGASGGRADIQIKDNNGNSLLIIECKTAGKEFDKAWDKTQKDGGQLFSYLQQDKATKFVCLYTSDFDNKKLNFRYYLIPTQDIKNLIEQYPEDDKNKPLFYKDAAKVEQLFQTWVQTYDKISYAIGIFEDEIPAYKISQKKFTAKQLKILPNNEIQKKYNEFAEILRTHNVSSKESAFDKLVNLFLCKIVDETQSQQTGNELAFYWKGEQFDDYFSLIDRLQVLYKEGMKEYLGEEITYVNNEMIDSAFWAVKNDKNATKKAIMDYFKELKFFTNNDFGFIDVHNRKLFYQNAAILLDVIKMWQDVQLNGDQQHQFLGDMFEFFLDKGFKQSEGQFFTPIPICRFILQSLPLESLIKNNPKPPQLIDYACGAGHFLTEYAAQLKALLTEDKKELLSSYYQAIFGVEKEYRLSKVAKISTFMYGQGDINVIYCDALKEIRQQIKNKDVLVLLESCDILVANPPFAVDFFLKNLSDKERKIYELIKTVADEQNNRNVQCFFIERAKQLLAPHGIAGIIVPSSVLSNSDATHIATREILLKHFDIVALVELGSGTFGKTGTNTVVLFLRRKAKIPTEAEQYGNRVLDWFEEDEAMDIYQDEYIIRTYCRHVGFEFEDYQNLLNNHLTDGLLATESLSDYKKAFDKSKSKKYFLAYVQEIEKNKLFYFAMAWHNPQEVLIVKSPADNKAQKSFLGYEWSAAKGNEGIKYNGGETVNEIITPLFDPVNRDNSDKLSYWIAQNFLGNEIDLSGLKDLEDLVSTARLIDMLDFSRVEFNKAISLSPKKSIGIDTKWDLVRLEDVVAINTKTGEPKKLFGDELFTYIDISSIESGTGRISFNTVISSEQAPSRARRIIQTNDILVSTVRPNLKSFALVTDLPKNVIASTGFAVLTVNDEKIISKFLYELLFVDILQNQMIATMGKGQYPSINQKDIENFKIPLPDKATQQLIVAECEQIDKEVENAEQVVNFANSQIKEKVASWFNKGFSMKKIENVFLLEYGKPLPEIKRVAGEYPVMGSNGISGYHNEYLIKAPAIIVGRKGSAGKVVYVEKNCYPIDTTFYIKLIKECSMKYLYWILIELELEKMIVGIGVPGINRNDVYQRLIPVPDLETQKNLVAEIELLEIKIAVAQQIINEAAAKKQAVLKRYL